MSPAPESRTDDEVLAAMDVALLPRYGLIQDAFRTALFGATPEAEARAARWLDTVAEIVGLRRAVRAGTV
ncbi:hypothetical protein [Streptomyces puniciscabiei]|uniref:hypothetical protein n=1 Tax=Streptomyces puniciscabiei TaxID=164348 RepID=UPI003791FD6F